MWIVRLALNRPYTFIVLAILILIAAPVVILRTPTDIFPTINIPVVSVAWQYTGLSPEELEGRVTTPYEKALTTLVDNIQHIESTTLNGQAIVKVYLQPGASLDTANAQVSAASEFMLKQLPPGILPPEIINFSASSVPILQLGLSGEGLSEQQLNDYGVNFIRPQLATIARRRAAQRLRRQATLHHGLSRSEGAAGQRPLTLGRPQRDGATERRRARGHRQDRLCGIRRSPQQFAVDHPGPREHTHQASQWRAWSTCATSQLSPTAPSRRPTSSARMATAAFSLAF